jgi:hypothetical protein
MELELELEMELELIVEVEVDLFFWALNLFHPYNNIYII